MLRLNLIGEIEPWRGDVRGFAAALPQARALLGYLATTGQPQRRERLSAMFGARLTIRTARCDGH